MKYLQNIITCSLLSLLAFTNSANATAVGNSGARSINVIKYQQEQDNITIKGPKEFTSGTGFYVTYNHIVTNEHVVQNCQYVKVRGATEPGLAEIVAIDKNNDLALLKTNKIPTMIAPIREDIKVSKGEKVTIMGYPKHTGINGNYKIKKATITETEQYFNGKKTILFSDAIEEGNSGGPLLDNNGTVVGVIVGKLHYYQAKNNNPLGIIKNNDKPFKTSAVAISLENLKSFLKNNNIFYNSDNTIYSHADQWVENKSKNYVVNVQCVRPHIALNTSSLEAK